MSDIEATLRRALAEANTAANETFVLSVADAIERHERKRTWFNAAMTLAALVLAGGFVYGLLLAYGVLAAAASTGATALMLAPCVAVLLMAAVAFALAAEGHSRADLGTARVR